MEPATLDALERHRDADYALTPYPHVQATMHALPRADVLGLVTHLPPEALGQIARLSARQTIGLVTRSARAIRPLTEMLRAATGFAGQLAAASAGGDARSVEQIARQADLVLYTPGCRRALRSVLPDAARHAPLDLTISPASLEAVRAALPL